VTADPVARPEADADPTTVMPPLEAPLPPYAQATGSYPSVPMSPSAPPPPPSYPPAATTPSVADAMVEISMPPLAPAVADTASEPVRPPAPVGSAGRHLSPEPAAELVPVDEPSAQSVDRLPAPASTTAAVMPPPAADTITCPECGTIAQVTLNRRESMDFCRNCDFPLFWTPTKVVRDPSATTDESLRRLPGQAGRATVASLPCPFCYEPNALSAETCIRCHRPMHPVEQAPPPPAPVYVPPPAPVVVETPHKVAWWVWALLGLGAALLVTLVVLIATGTIG
jgi:hypothetical protein